jgi:DUF1365 family protein
MTMAASCVYEGEVRHRRLTPVRHDLRYRVSLMYVDIDELPEIFDGHALWSARRPALAWFRRRDYLGPHELPLDQAVRALVKDRTGVRVSGPVRVLTQLRCLGHCFNPVSFYFCFDEHGERVDAVVAEVTNTPWGERHAYVMARPAGGERVLRMRFAKQLHVSPLMGMDHSYDWRVLEPGRELIVHIDSLREGEKVFDATLTLQRRELSRRTLRRMLWRYPAATLTALARIYSHALRLRLKGARWYPHPARARG